MVSATHPVPGVEGLQLVPMDQVPDDDVISVFNSGFSDYYHAVGMDLMTFHEYLSTNDIDRAQSLVAYVDHQPVGFTFTGIRGDQGWVGGLAVDPRHRRHHVGWTLLQEQLDILQRAGVVRVTLECIERNTAALNLYDKAGFHRLRKVYYLQQDRPRIKLLPAEVEFLEVEAADVVPHRTKPQTWSKQVRSMLQTPDHKAVLAHCEGKLVGHAVYFANDTLLYVFDIDSRSYSDHLLNHLIDKTRPERVTAANIFDKRLLGTFASNGFLITLTLWEMEWTPQGRRRWGLFG